MIPCVCVCVCVCVCDESLWGHVMLSLQYFEFVMDMLKTRTWSSAGKNFVHYYAASLHIYTA